MESCVVEDEVIMQARQHLPKECSSFEHFESHRGWRLGREVTKAVTFKDPKRDWYMTVVLAGKGSLQSHTNPQPRLTN